MAFHVDVQPQAFDDLDLIVEYIKERSSFAIAEKWVNGIMDRMATLEEMPERCPIAPESEEIGQPVRVLLYGRKNRTYKVFRCQAHIPRTWRRLRLPRPSLGTEAVDE